MWAKITIEIIWRWVLLARQWKRGRLNPDEGDERVMIVELSGSPSGETDEITFPRGYR